MCFIAIIEEMASLLKMFAERLVRGFQQRDNSEHSRRRNCFAILIKTLSEKDTYMHLYRLPEHAEKQMGLRPARRLR